jgi:hypothetical protein
MKKRNPRIKKPRKGPTRKAKASGPVRITVPWGRAASDYRPGLFVKQYFAEHGEVCCADVFRALKENLERMNGERVETGELPIRGSTYNSFAKYWHWFKLLGLIEPVNRREASIYPFLEQRVFYRLTGKGKDEKQGWDDPVRTAHPEFD